MRHRVLPQDLEEHVVEVHHQQEHCHDQTPEGEGGLRVSINFKFLGTPPKLLTFSPTLTNATAFLKKYKKDAETSVTIF